MAGANKETGSTGKDGAGKDSGGGDILQPVVVGEIYTATGAPNDAGGNKGNAEGNGESSVSAKRKPGRPAGSTKAKEIPLDLTSTLKGICSGLAVLLKAKEFELGEYEAKELNKVSTELAKYSTVTVDPKHLAMFNFTFVTLGIFIPKIMEWRDRVKKDKAKDNARKDN
jgi:hypothetical protein